MSNYSVHLKAYLSILMLSVFFVRSGHAQTQVVAPALTPIGQDSVSFSSAADLIRINRPSNSVHTYWRQKRRALDWKIGNQSGISKNSHVLLKDALPSWMDAQMWNSMSRAARNSGYQAGPNVLDPPPAERNFEIHMDAQERYGSYDH